MILGLLSDTHDRPGRTARALRLLQQLGAEAFVHCGDIGGDAVLDQFAGLRTWFVWGNVDRVDQRLVCYAGSLGLTLPRSVPTRIELEGRTLAVYHGHERGFRRLFCAVRDQDVVACKQMLRGLDYVLYGHTHVAADVSVLHARMINPGALQRACPYTVARLDLSRGALDFWQVDERVGEGDLPRRFVPGAARGS